MSFLFVDDLGFIISDNSMKKIVRSLEKVAKKMIE